MEKFIVKSSALQDFMIIEDFYSDVMQLTILQAKIAQAHRAIKTKRENSTFNVHFNSKLCLMVIVMLLTTKLLHHKLKISFERTIIEHN